MTAVVDAHRGHVGVESICSVLTLAPSADDLQAAGACGLLEHDRWVWLSRSQWRVWAVLHPTSARSCERAANRRELGPLLAELGEDRSGHD